MKLVLLTSLLHPRHQTLSTRAHLVAFNQLTRHTKTEFRFGIQHTLHSAMASDVAAPRRSTRLAKLENINEADAPNDYNSMKVTELKELLKQNELSVSGNKADLIARLKSFNTQGRSSCAKSETSSAASSSKRRKISRKVTPDIKEDGAKIDSKQNQTVSIPSNDTKFLPRTREMQLKSANDKLMVIGVDEAGRGPLAGPVVAAAAIVPTNISGVIDSKKITKEEEREQLYEAIIASPGVRYAVAVVSAQRIDEINILQATLEGMRMATNAVMKLGDKNVGDGGNNIASAERTEVSYVVSGCNRVDEKTITSNDSSSYYALIDGNKVPKEMPCPAESMVKGDGREFAVAAASILAKVTRDRLMHEYDKKYPEYDLSKHKGYPTAGHMAVVKRIGASPIHRRTFAPLKNMAFDKVGKVTG